MPFEKIQFENKHIVGFKAIGKITQEDYTKTLLPIFEEARDSGEKLRVFLSFGSDFEGYTLNAAWEDSKFGLKYLRTIEKAAVVSDQRWIKRLSSFFGSLIPCPVKVFDNSQIEAAKAWIEFGKSGLVHSLDEATGVLTVKVFSPLSSEDFEVMGHVVDSYIERKGTLKGIVICAEKFPGWENFGSFLRHFEFIKGHHKLVERVALVADGELSRRLPSMADHFIEAQLKHFDRESLSEAQAWAKGESAGVDSPRPSESGYEGESLH